MKTIYHSGTGPDLESSILHTISWSLNVPATRLNTYTSLSEDLLLDPIDVTLLIATLEYRLNVFLSEEEAARIETVGDFQRFFRARSAAA